MFYQYKDTEKFLYYQNADTYIVYCIMMAGR